MFEITYVSSVGPYVEQFESEIAKYTGSKYAVATTNGTSGLHLALKVAGVCQGDEVLVPSATFVASANAISYVNAYPNFIDTNEENLDRCTKMADYLSKIATYKNGNVLTKKPKEKLLR